jgi:hypothetical protein
VAKWSPRSPRLAATLYVSLLLAGLLTMALAVRPNATLELLRNVWLEDLFWLLLPGAVGVAVAGVVMAVQAYRDRDGWGFYLLRLAWMAPGWVTVMAVFFMVLRLFMLLVGSGSPILMAAAVVVGVALVELVVAALRSRGARMFLNRPRAWWMRMLVIQGCALAAGLAILHWALYSGRLGAR